MSINSMGIFFTKIGHDTKNTIDMAGSLCYNKTIERQETRNKETRKAED